MTDNNRRRSSMFDRELVLPAIWASIRKLNPRHQIHNPVMFVVEVGAVITTIGWVNQAFGNSPLGGGNARIDFRASSKPQISREPEKLVPFSRPRMWCTA